MSSTIYINGTDVTSDVSRETVSIKREISYKNSVLTFSMRNITTLPAKGDFVEFYDSTTLTFSGIVVEANYNTVLPEKRATVVVTDWHRRTVDELVRTSYDDTELGAMIRDIITTRIHEDDLRNMLQFEEGSGTTVDDETTYDNDATLNGGITWDTTNFAIDLDGASGSYVSVADDADLDFSSDVSMCIEVTLDALNVTVFAKENGANEEPYKITIDASGFITFQVASGIATAHTVVDASTALSTGTKYTIVCTHNRDSGIGKIYIDGVEVKSGSTTTSNIINGTGALVIGISSGTSLDGKVNRTSIYGKTLSATEARRWHLDCLEMKAPDRLIAGSGIQISRAVFPFLYPNDCFTTLANELGLAWRVDAQMFLRFTDQVGIAPVATFDEDDGSSMVSGSLTVNVDIAQLRNVVYVRGGVYTAAWRSDLLKADGSDNVFALPYRYTGFEMFTDTAGLAADVESWYKCDDSSGNLADSKGSNTLTATALTYNTGAGKQGGSIEFDGSTSVARKTAATHVTGDTAHSLEAWVNPDVHDTTQRVILGFGDFAAGHSKISLIKVSTTFYLRHDFGDSIVTDVDIGDISGGWHHIAVTYDPDASGGKTLKFYLDQALKNTTKLSSTPDIDAGVVEMGGNNASTVFDGDIDEATIYKYALSLQEVQASYRIVNTSALSLILLRSGVEFLNETGFDAYYNYQEKNYKFDTAPSTDDLLYPSGEPQLPVQAVHTNAASIATYGRREIEISDPTVEQLAVARQLASAELSKRKNPNVRINFMTYVTGVDPGEIISVVLPNHGIATGNYLVQKAELKYYLHQVTGAIHHQYKIEAVNVISKDWIDFLRDSFQRRRKQIDPGEDEVIADLIDHAEDVNVAEVWSFPTHITQAEDMDFADAQPTQTVTSGQWKWSNDAGSTVDKLRWNLGDWG